MLFDENLTDDERKNTLMKVRDWNNSRLIGELRSLQRATIPETYGYLIVEALARVLENTKPKPRQPDILDELRNIFAARKDYIRSLGERAEQFDSGQLVLIEEIENWIASLKEAASDETHHV